MLSPKRSVNDRYSIEQRRERELYRDSNKYSSRRETFDHRESDFNDRQDMSQRIPLSDHRRGIFQSNDRSFECNHEQNLYEVDNYRSRNYDASYHEGNHTRSYERTSEYEPRSSSYDAVAQYERRNSELMNFDETYRDDYRRFDEGGRRNGEEQYEHSSRRREVDHNRRTRGFDDRDIQRSSSRYGIGNEYEQPPASNCSEQDIYREDDRHSSRRRRDSGGRRGKKRRKKFDGSDEYSRRLDSYNQSHGRDHFNDDIRRDRYNR
mmetsp:Transcript_12889/g.29744  ORF Transcript_12889/g.29744 Transcript_12889/m.29744 type:complete len:264 (+) Transcript_12889:637-1428(+)